MTTGSHNDTRTTGPSDLRTVSTIVQLLAGAIKHHTLYPEDHSIAKQHISKIYENFCLFLKKHKTLRLEIGKSTILYDGDVVYQGRPDENDIAFLLGRDGVEWIEFSRDLELPEIQSLLRIINNNRRCDTQSDGNISTVLWEQDFPHIEYKTIDFMAMDLPLLNLNSFRVAPGPETATDEHTDRTDRRAYSSQEDEDADGDEDDYGAEAISGIPLTDHGSSLWSLTELEQFQLEAMVNKEENDVDTESTIEVLSILLLVQTDRQETAETLAFLQDRFLYCLQKNQFTSALKIIRTLTKINAAEQKRQEWLCPLILDLFKEVAQPESLRDLEKFFTVPANFIPDNELNALWTLVQLLPPDVLKTLAPLSGKIDLQRFGPPFLDIFKYFCTINSRHVAAVAAEIHQKICFDLFPFLHTIRTDQSIPVLSAMARHSSPLVRSKAFLILVEWDAVDIKELFPLIDDPDETIRQTILSQAGKKRSTDIERMLRNYLEKHAGDTRDRDHVLACYHALGKSGSAESIPFLKKALFQRSSIGTLFTTGGGAHKEGAARALRDIRIPEAREIIQEGATHILPDVKAACRKALGTEHD